MWTDTLCHVSLVSRTVFVVMQVNRMYRETEDCNVHVWGITSGLCFPAFYFL